MQAYERKAEEHRKVTVAVAVAAAGREEGTMSLIDQMVPKDEAEPSAEPSYACMHAYAVVYVHVCKPVYMHAQQVPCVYLALDRAGSAMHGLTVKRHVCCILGRSAGGFLLARLPAGRYALWMNGASRRYEAAA